MNVSGFLIFTLVLVVVAVLFAFQSVKVVPQQTAWVVERLGKFHAVLTPGLNFIIPFIATPSRRSRSTRRARSASRATIPSSRSTASSSSK